MGPRLKSTIVRFSLNQYSSIACSGFKVETGGAKVNDCMFGEELSTAAQISPILEITRQKNRRAFKNAQRLCEAMDHQIACSGSEEICFVSFGINASGERNSMRPGETHATRTRVPGLNPARSSQR